MSYDPAQSPTGDAVISEDTTLSLNPLSIIASKGDTITFTGTLKDGDGVGVAGKTIHFFLNDEDTGVSAVTDQNGDYTLDYTWTAMGVFTYYTRYFGD